MSSGARARRADEAARLGQKGEDPVATAVVEERQLLKSLRWWDGFVIALCNPGFLISSLGFTMGALGTTGALLLWTMSALIGLMQAWIYSEAATMFPDKTGGISLYGHEGWRSRFSLVGPIGAFGYWIGWSVVLSIFGNLIGALIQSQWFPRTDWTWWTIAGVHFGLPQALGVAAIIFVWLFNVLGVRPAIWLGYVTGVGLMVPLAILIVGPFVSGHWHSANMTWTIPGGYSGFKLVMVYMFLNGWSAYGVEVSATFAPEFHDTRRDTSLALRTGAGFMLFVCIFLPLGLGGEYGAPSAATATGQFYTKAMADLVGTGGASVLTVLLIGSLLLAMMSSTADAARALFGISRDGMTVKQLYHLNKNHVPARAMTVDLVVNTCLIVFVANNLAILYMSNIGYILAHVLALSGFLLLRKDRPKWPRPIKVGGAWVVATAVLMVLNAAFLVYGLTNPGLAYGVSSSDTFIGVGVIVASVLLYVYRRLVQDRKPLVFRDQVSLVPTPAQMALLTEELAPATVASS